MSCLEIRIRERVLLVNAKVVQVSLQNNILSLLFKALPNHPKQQFFEKVTIPQSFSFRERDEKQGSKKCLLYQDTHKRPQFKLQTILFLSKKSMKRYIFNTLIPLLK